MFYPQKSPLVSQNPNHYGNGGVPTSHVPTGFDAGGVPMSRVPTGFDAGGVPMSRVPTGFKQGGRPSRRKLTPVHINRHELNILDHLQGKTEIDPRSNKRSYAHLEEVLKNPHVLSLVHHHAHKYTGGHMAEGGHMADGGYTPKEMDRLAAHGVHGDHEMALMGPHTITLLKHLGGGHIANNRDGYPQFYSLGGALGGIWDTLKGAGSAAWNGIKSAAPTLGRIAAKAAPDIGAAIGNYIKPGLGTVIGGHAGNLAGQGLQHLSEQGGESYLPQEVTDALGEGIGAGAGAYSTGKYTPKQAFGVGVQNVGESFGLSPMENIGKNLQEGQGFRQAMSLDGMLRDRPTAPPPAPARATPPMAPAAAPSPMASPAAPPAPAAAPSAHDLAYSYYGGGYGADAAKEAAKALDPNNRGYTYYGGYAS